MNISGLIAKLLFFLFLLVTTPVCGQTIFDTPQDDINECDGSYTVAYVTGPQAQTLAFQCNCDVIVDDDSHIVLILIVPKDICL